MTLAPPLLSPAEPIYRFNRYLRARFPWRTYKVTLHGGFTCPNLDGKIARGGCTYCSNRTFAPQLAFEGGVVSVREQLERGKAALRERYRAERFFAYFQSYTNTYAPVATLERVYGEALADPEVVALAVGTRPDCAGEPVLDLLEALARGREVWVEYGMQSAHDRTAERTNRACTLAQFEDALVRTARRPALRVCVHVILGLPGEDHAMMMETARVLSRLPYHSLKVHHLYVARGTALEREHAAGQVRTLELGEYVPLVCDFLERISPGTSVQRLVGELLHPDVVAPRWGASKGEIERRIGAEFLRRGTAQGSRFEATGRTPWRRRN